MYLRACEKGLIRCPRKLDEYDFHPEVVDEIRNNIMGSVINGEEEEAR